MFIPFDNNSGEYYNLEVHVDDIEEGDGVVLHLNRRACESFSKIFGDLAKSADVGHIHLGYSHDEPQGPGLRIVVCEDNTNLSE